MYYNHIKHLDHNLTKVVSMYIAHCTGGGEEDLSLLLMNYTDSPFFYDTSYFFLSERETEINTIKYWICRRHFSECFFPATSLKMSRDQMLLQTPTS